MKTISRYIMTLALLLTAVGGAWAQDANYDIDVNFDNNYNPEQTPFDCNIHNVQDLDAEIKGTLDLSVDDVPMGSFDVDGELLQNFITPGLDAGDHTWTAVFKPVGGGEFSRNGNFRINKAYTSIYYNGSTSINLGVGESTELDANIIPEGAGVLSYSSSDASVVSITKENSLRYIIEAKAAGTATITFSFAGNTNYNAVEDVKITVTVSTPPIDVTTDAAEEGATFTEASFDMPTSDVTVNYELVRDMTVDVSAEVGDGSDGYRIRIKKDGDDFVPVKAEEMLISVSDDLDEQHPIDLTVNTDFTLLVQKKGEGDTWTDLSKEDKLSVGTFRYKVTGVGNYTGTIYSNEFTVVEQYDLTVKPADEYSKTGLENVTVGTETPTINEAGEAAKTGIAPNTEVKLTTTTGYIITDVNATNINQVTISEAKTEATFTMPQSDVDATYTIKRDMTVDVTASIDDRIRIKKDGNDYQPVGKEGDIDASAALPTVTDNLDAENPVTMTEGTDKDYTLTLQKQGDTEDDWTDVTGYSVGTFRYMITGTGNYSGVIYTDPFKLFEGYEVEVPAGEYITYYKDEALYVEDTDAKLYTITAVSGTTATADELTIAPANTPLLVKNNGSETKTILLIPTTTDTPDNVTPYEGFTGTLEAATIAASDATQDNYAWNGLQFVWVKAALSIAANKAWLQVPAAASAPQRIQIVFSSTTGIGAIDGLQSEGEGAWYDLNGRRLPGKPTKKGVYILNGKKMVVK